MKRYRVEVGWHDGLKPGSLVGAIANEAGLEGREIGTINIQDRHAFVDLPTTLPLDVIESLGETKIRGKALRLAALVGSGPPVTRKRAIGKFLGRGKSKPRN
jgi:ATP-dependent RNA helicase DeaD